jgi:hypothetical protein
LEKPLIAAREEHVIEDGGFPARSRQPSMALQTVKPRATTEAHPTMERTGSKKIDVVAAAWDWDSWSSAVAGSDDVAEHTLPGAHSMPVAWPALDARQGPIIGRLAQWS